MSNYISFRYRLYVSSSNSFKQQLAAISHPDEIPDFEDPRLTYKVNMEEYVNTDMSDNSKLKEELLEGNGITCILFLPMRRMEDEPSTCNELI